MSLLEGLTAQENAAYWLALISVLSFFGTLVLIPWVVVRIPADYFAGHKRPAKKRTYEKSPVVMVCVALVKNVFGALLVLLGLIMLVTPGQGVLTLIVGILIMNFPGKFALERWLVSRGPTLALINTIRRRRGRPPLRLEREELLVRDRDTDIRR